MIHPAQVGFPVLLHGPHTAEPLAGTIAAVNQNGTVNIGFLDSIGTHHAKQNVKLVTEGDPKPGAGEEYAESYWAHGAAADSTHPIADEQTGDSVAD